MPTCHETRVRVVDVPSHRVLALLRNSSRLALVALAVSALIGITPLGPAAAQGAGADAPAGADVGGADADTEAVLRPGEAYVTRFSGTTERQGPGGPSATVIDREGTVGSIVDILTPGEPPVGQNWIDEPQRNPLKASEVGQVFGVALDDASPPNVYLTATSAYALHRTTDNRGWMPGMWGPKGGPGTVYKLDAAKGYAPSVFANITLDGRVNTGPALGNIAYDKWSRQLLVSDLETGMIHRLRITDGKDMGRYDHGVDGRGGFLDAATGTTRSLPAVAFDPSSKAQVAQCAAGRFDSNPECWNYADFRRRVWGLGVRRDPSSGEVRLYYGAWSSDALGSPAWSGAAEEEKRNAVWSVAIGADGAFALGSTRREIVMPGFFKASPEPARRGTSHALTDIAFPTCIEQNVMLVSERAAVRNLGLENDDPFAYPHEARVLRYERDASGVWQLKGRHDVGSYQRSKEGPPAIRADSAGGIDFGYGYGEDGTIDLGKPDQMVWMTGDYLCSPDGPCIIAGTEGESDDSQVHGLQGTPATAIAPLESSSPEGARQSYFIDTDIDMDANGQPIVEEFIRNDATKIGDVAIYQLCDVAPTDEAGDVPMPVPGDSVPVPVPTPPDYVPTPEPPLPPGEGPDLQLEKTGPAECTIDLFCTYTITVTNLGPGTYVGPLFVRDFPPPGSTLTFFGPAPPWSCIQFVAGGDIQCAYPEETLLPGQSVSLTLTVQLPGPPPLEPMEVENCAAIDWPTDNPEELILAVEAALALEGYDPGPIDGVITAETEQAIRDYQTDYGLDVTGVVDDQLIETLFPDSAGLPGDGNVDNDFMCHTSIVPVPAVAPVLPPPTPATPVTTLAHTRGLSHFRNGSHSAAASHFTGGSHNQRLSHFRFASHSKAASHLRSGSHNAHLSHYRWASHTKAASHWRQESHNATLSHRRHASHTKAASHWKDGSHNAHLSHHKLGSHTKAASHLKTGSHNTRLSHQRKGSHTKAASHLKQGSHTTHASHHRKGSHSKAASSHGEGKHNAKVSHARQGSHAKLASHQRKGSHTKALSKVKSGDHHKQPPKSGVSGHTKAQTRAVTGGGQKKVHTKATVSGTPKITKVKPPKKTSAQKVRVPKASKQARPPNAQKKHGKAKSQGKG